MAVVTINTKQAGAKVHSPHTKKLQHGHQRLSESIGPIGGSTRPFSTSPSSGGKDYFTSKSVSYARCIH